MKHHNTINMQALALALMILGAQQAIAGKPGGGTPGGGSNVGVVTIDQDKAAAGGVTSGDAPGFPVTLSQPGSYRLESNLTVPDTLTTAIEITADDVTLDLNGFVISGPNVCSSPGTCQYTDGGTGVLGATRNSAVFGGTIRGMGKYGVALGRNARVERLHARFNGTTGILTGLDSLIADCTVELNGVFGIRPNNGSLVLRNVIAYNSYGGAFDSDSQLPSKVSIGANVFMLNAYEPFSGNAVHILPNSCFGNFCF